MTPGTKHNLISAAIVITGLVIFSLSVTHLMTMDIGVVTTDSDGVVCQCECDCTGGEP